MLYIYIKAFHIIAIICWMAGALYLPRLFVYHSRVNHLDNQEAYDMLLLMEKRLLFYITLPSMVASVLLGVFLLFDNPAFLFFWWLHLKLFCVLLLILFTLLLCKFYHNFYHRCNGRSSGFFRSINEIPAVMMVIIVILVVVQP